MNRHTYRPATRFALTALVALTAASCSWVGLGGEEEATAEQRRARCDQMAAQAIEAESLLDARRLAAQATDCYAAEVERGDDR